MEGQNSLPNQETFCIPSRHTPTCVVISNVENCGVFPDVYYGTLSSKPIRK